MGVDDADRHVAPSFFKIILEPRNDLQKLRIPEKFMTGYGRELENVLTLEIPTGKTWKVKLLREDERGWFRHGWAEFVEYNSIRYGHFLMFAYEGESRFKVFVFDMTACEVEYPPFVTDETSDEVQTPVSDVPEESGDEMPTSVSDETMTSEGDLCSPSASSNEKRMVDLVRRYRTKKGTLCVTPEDIKKINSRQFKIPAFTILVKPSYLYTYRATIPLTFDKKYLKNAQSSCILKDAAGCKWPVDIDRHKPTCTRFQKGWRMFARENKLRVGDACVFELINAAKCVFRVEVLPHSGVGAYTRGRRED